MKQKTMKKLIVRLTIAKVVFGLLGFILTIVFIICIMNKMNSIASSQRADFDEKEGQSITAAKNTYSSQRPKTHILRSLHREKPLTDLLTKSHQILHLLMKRGKRIRKKHLMQFIMCGNPEKNKAPTSEVPTVLVILK